MMAEMPVLEVSSRDGTGKGAARSARREGMVPGVVYGGGKDPVTINVPHNVLLKSLKAGGFLTTLINLKIDGSDNTVICRAVQRDIVRDLPIHVDFLRLSERSRINLMIPVDFLNENDAPGIRQGGMLTVVRPEIELRVRASDIPEKIEVDLSGLEIGDTVKISDVTLPQGAEPTITDRDFMIANIAAPKGLGADEDEEEDAEAVEAPTEGEESTEEEATEE
ncbi:MAG: 50S ribosomal protein L25/general stress protein Ctc [Pseudomonadota bacterium]